MRRFITKIVFFVLIFWMGDLLLVRLLEYFRPIDYKQFIDAKREFYSSNKYYDLIVIGDSHISDALDTRIIDSRLGLSSFNLGVYHSSPYEWYALLASCLRQESGPPKYIVIGTNPDMFFRKQTIGKYTPVIMNDLLTEYSLYRKSDDGLDPSFFIETIKQSYLFSALWHSVTGVTYKPTRVVASVYSGYLETINNNGLNKSSNLTLLNKQIVPEQIKYFELILSISKKYDIKVVVVNSSMWKELQLARNNDESFLTTQRVVREICDAYGVEVFNDDYSFGADELSQDDFLDSQHLNARGAGKFTSEFCRWFKKNIN